MCVVAVLAACGQTADPPTDQTTAQAPPTGGNDTGAKAPPGPAGTATEQNGSDVPVASPTLGPAGNEGDGGGTTPTPTSGPGGPPSATVDDLGAVGANGRAYLRPDRPRMLVEIDVQDGARMGQDAVDHLLATIRTYVDKPDGVQLAGGNAVASGREQWNCGDLRATADANRDHYSDATTTVLYVLYVSGGFFQDGEQTQALGVACNASEMALFPDRWSGIGALVGADRNIERAVLVHEFGHLLGLVNLTYQSAIDHESDEHPGHSSNRQSVMYYAVETTLIGQVFDGPPPQDFDEADRADIEGLRTGRY